MKILRTSTVRFLQKCGFQLIILPCKTIIFKFKPLKMPWSPLFKNTQIILEYLIFDEKALKKARRLFSWFLVAKASREECMEADIAVISRISFLLLSLLCLVTSQANYSMSEDLAIVRIKNTPLFSNKARAIQWLPPRIPPWERFGDRKFQKLDGLILVPSHRKLKSFACS